MDPHDHPAEPETSRPRRSARPPARRLRPKPPTFTGDGGVYTAPPIPARPVPADRPADDEPLPPGTEPGTRGAADLYPYVRTSLVTDRYVVGSPRPDEDPPAILVYGEGGSPRVYFHGRYVGQLLGIEERQRPEDGTLEFVLLLRNSTAALGPEAHS